MLAVRLALNNARRIGSVNHMMIVIPQSNHRPGYLMFVTHRLQAYRIQHEGPAGLCRFEPNPAGSQHTDEMPARKNQHIPLHIAQAVDYSVSSCVNLAWRLTARTSIAKQLPVRPLPADLGTGM